MVVEEAEYYSADFILRKLCLLRPIIVFYQKWDTAFIFVNEMLAFVE